MLAYEWADKLQRIALFCIHWKANKYVLLDVQDLLLNNDKFSQKVTRNLICSCSTRVCWKIKRKALAEKLPLAGLKVQEWRHMPKQLFAYFEQKNVFDKERLYLAIESRSIELRSQNFIRIQHNRALILVRILTDTVHNRIQCPPWHGSHLQAMQLIPQD